MTNRSTFYGLAAWPLLLGLAACGGGGSGLPPLPTLPPPVPNPSALPAGDLITFGPLSTGSSFSIADVVFEPATAQVTVNEQPGSLPQLQTGHLVAMVGSTDTSGRSTAEELHFNANLIGNVDSVDVNANTVVVMGQTIRVVDASVLTTPLSNFTRGEVVQVSGYANDDGTTVAARIDYSVSNAELRLIGQVTALDSANFRFSINNLDVDYSRALMIDTPDGDVTSGMEVLITGARSPDGTFRVQSLTHFDRDLSDFIGAHVRGEGRITAAASGADFSLNSFPVVMGGQRDYRQGSADDIIVGAEVRIEGEILSDATVQVHRVWFLRN